MAQDLFTIYEDLISIRKYLIKKGQSRFKGSVATIKLKEAELLFNKSELIFSKLSRDEKPAVVTTLTTTYDNIKQLFQEISQLCTPIVSISDKMSFDIRTACSFIPIMDGKEETTKRLIDTIEMYSEMLDGPETKHLIKFVLKGRLTETAKLRLASDYTSIADLLRDLKKHLLPPKSSTAIQSRLHDAYQGRKSIDEYGSELEKLFTDLTISQAGGDTAKFDILKHINENTAIKKFADGLKDTRLSTIIAARNFSSLRDAIQAAKDESVGRPTSTNTDVMQYSRRPQGKTRPHSSPRYQGQRGQHAPQQAYRGNHFRGRSSSRPFQNYNNRGRFNGSRYFRRNVWHGNNNRNIYTVQQTENNTPQDNSMPGSSQINSGSVGNNNNFFRP